MTGLKKIKTFGLKERMYLINKQDNCYSLREQSILLGVNRSTLYYKPAEIRTIDRVLMDLLDEQYTRTPFYGVL